MVHIFQNQIFLKKIQKEDSRRSRKDALFCLAAVLQDANLNITWTSQEHLHKSIIYHQRACSWKLFFQIYYMYFFKHIIHAHKMNTLTFITYRIRSKTSSVYTVVINDILILLYTLTFITYCIRSKTST